MNFARDRLPTPIGILLLVFDEQDRLRALDWEDFESRMRRLLRLQYGREVEANASTMASLPLDCFVAALLAMTTTDGRFLHHIPGRARSEVYAGCVNLPTLRDPGTRANASAPGSRVSLRCSGKVELPGVGTASWPGLARPSTTK